MSRRWIKERKRERYYLRAKSENYRSRAAYKLKQLQEKFGMLSPGMRCIDLGAAPGGWLQVEKELVGSAGTVVGIDLSTIRPIDGATVMKGDATSPEIVEKLLEAAGGRVDAVLSDMSPDISGSYALDHARSADLVRTAHSVSRQLLRNGGCFVAKLFDGEMTPVILDGLRADFSSVRVTKPGASRKNSSEVYIVAKGFSGA